MKVMLSKFNEQPFYKLQHGDVFRIGIDVYMRINKVEFNVVSLENGNLGSVDNNRMVTVINGKFVEDSSAIVIERS
jgi:hypothetical protein